MGSRSNSKEKGKRPSSEHTIGVEGAGEAG
jgi:hypothetical protein